MYFFKVIIAIPKTSYGEESSLDKNFMLLLYATDRNEIFILSQMFSYRFLR